MPPGPPALVSPTASRPLTLLSIGDSIGEDLGFGLGDVFSTDPAVRVVQEGLEDTGLARTDYYNWPATLAVDLHRYRPKIVVVMLGANDAQALYVSGTTYLPFGTPSASPGWWRVYTARVALVMQEATDAGAHVMWVGLPPMGPGSTVPSWFPQQLNRVFYAEALSHPGVAYFSAAKVLSSDKGGFTEYMNIGGSELAVRSADGVHLLNAGYDLLAGDLVRTDGAELAREPPRAVVDCTAVPRRRGRFCASVGFGAPSGSLDLQLGFSPPRNGLLRSRRRSRGARRAGLPSPEPRPRPSRTRRPALRSR